MNKVILQLNIKKFAQYFHLRYFRVTPVIRKKRNVIVFNYQKGFYSLYYTGLVRKNNGSLLSIVYQVERSKDDTVVKFLLFSPIIIYLF